MRLNQKLWILTLTLPATAAEVFADSFGEEAVAVTVLSPPRDPVARIEVLYQDEPQKESLEAKLKTLSASLGLPAPEFTLAPTPDLDWLKKVAEDFPPLVIARWTVHGAMHRDKVPDRRYALQIDATNAFGTGEHPTTRGCLLMLDSMLEAGFRPQRMADIGCGSGILAMACAQGVGAQAFGIDLDSDSVETAMHNVQINGLTAQVQIEFGDGYAAPLIQQHAPYDLIMANIFADPLIEMAEDLKNNLGEGGCAILSGLLTSQADGVIAAHEKQGLTLIEHKKLGEWSVLALRRQGRA